MQLNTMDCSSRSNAVERDSEISENLSHGDHSDDEMRDCDSMDGDLVISGNGLVRASRFTSSLANSSGGGELSFTGGINSGGVRTPDHQTEMQMSHHHQFPSNHPLGALGNFMGISGLHGLPNLQQHNDVLEKLKMQVRDIKVGLMEQDYATAHAAAAFGSSVMPTPINAFSMPPTTMPNFGHSQSLAASANNSSSGSNNNNNNSGTSSSHNNNNSISIGSVANGAVGVQNSSVSTVSAASALTNGSFSFTSPTAPSTKEVNPASNSSTSSEASNSSLQNNGWSFEEQYKQVRQLYEINDDPKRKEFLDDLFSFMQKRGSPINRLPIMAKSVLDLYELYNLVIARGGLVDVINKKLWQEIIKGLHLPSSITSAAFTLRTQYMKYLYPYECEKKNLSSPAELQAAIDGNRREGRRSSYGQFEAMHNQLQIPQAMRQSLPSAIQQMSPLALVTHAAAQSGPTAQSAVAAAVAHHRLMGPAYTQVPNLMANEIEQRMIEYLKIIQGSKESLATPLQQQQQQQKQHQQHQQQQHQQQQQQHLQQHQQRQRSQSPELTTREALNALEMSRVALWQMYHNNTSPPSSVNTSPQGVGGLGAAGVGVEPQREALNLSDSPSPNLCTIKRERDHEPEVNDSDDFQHLPPPSKRCAVAAGVSMPNFYLPHSMASAGFPSNMRHDSDGEHEAEDEDDDDEDEEGNEMNTRANSLSNERHTINDHHHHQQQQLYQHHSLEHHSNHHNINNDKSDDSAIESSPTTTASAGNGHISPVSTKKIHLTKQQQHHHHRDGESAAGKQAGNASGGFRSGSSSGICSPMEQLSLLSGMQFHVSRNGTGANGEQQLFVNLELNGIRYSGVLVAGAAPAAGSLSTAEDLQADAPPATPPPTAASVEAANASNTTTTTSPTTTSPSSLTPTTNTEESAAQIGAGTTEAGGETPTASPLKLTNGPSSGISKDSLLSS